MKLIEEVIALVNKNDFINSRKLLINFLKQDNDTKNPDAYHLLGLIYLNKNKIKIGVILIEKALKLKNSWLYHYNLGINLIKRDLEKSIFHLNNANKLKNNNENIIIALVQAFLIKGDTIKCNELLEENKKFLSNNININILIFEIKIKINKSNDAENILCELICNKEFNSEKITRVVKIIINNKIKNEYINDILTKKLRKELVAVNSNEAILNYGNFFMHINEYDEAIEVFSLIDNRKKSIIISVIYNNIGICYINKGEKNIARNYFIRSIEADQTNSMPIINMLNNYNGLEDIYLYDLIKKIVDENYFIKNNILMGYIYYYKSKIFDYENIKDIVNIVIKNIRDGIYTEPYILLGMIDSLEIVNQNINLYNEKLNLRKNNITNRTIINKKKICFVSADIKQHAVYYMIIYFMRTFKKLEYEVTCLALNKIPTDIEEQLKNYGINSKYVGDKNDREMCDYIKNQEFYVIFDLGGFTGKNKPGVFNGINNAIIINYLGYLASCGDKYHDYIISDKYLISEDSKKYYGENIIYLDKYYWINNDYKVNFFKKINKNNDTLNLICMNSEFKYNEEILDIWAFILQFNCKLSLCIEGKRASENIRNFFLRKNISIDKIEILPKVDYRQHISRLANFDIALDTFPSTSGTVAIDCLRNLLPIVTICGNSMAARICGSILNKIELDELICKDYKEYQNILIKLLNFDYLNNIREKIAKNISGLYINEQDEYNLNKTFERLIK